MLATISGSAYAARMSGVVTCWYRHLRVIEHVNDIAAHLPNLIARDATLIQIRYDEEEIGGCDA